MYIYIYIYIFIYYILGKLCVRESSILSGLKNFGPESFPLRAGWGSSPLIN